MRLDWLTKQSGSNVLPNYCSLAAILVWFSENKNKTNGVFGTSEANRCSVTRNNLFKNLSLDLPDFFFHK